MKDNKPQNDIVIYQTNDGEPNIQVRIEGETAWLTQKDLAELNQTTKNNISLHVKNIFEEGELKQKATVKEFLTVQYEGARQVSRNIEHYNLDLIISVSYRIHQKKESNHDKNDILPEWSKFETLQFFQKIHVRVKYIKSFKLEVATHTEE